MPEDVAKCGIRPLFTEVINKPQVQPHFGFDLLGFTSVFAPPLWADTCLWGDNRQESPEERLHGGGRWHPLIKHEKYLLYLWRRPTGAFISAQLNAAVDNITVPVLFRV